MINSYEHIMDTLIHKQCVLKACENMVQYLYSQGREDDALNLSRRCSIHDNSKFELPEYELFSSLPIGRESLKDPKLNISNDMIDVIKVHWKNNTHHPEHFQSYKDMSELDIIEMVCDWYARSLQYHTNFLEFVKERQDNRFHFDDAFFTKVFNYCMAIYKKEDFEKFAE